MKIKTKIKKVNKLLQNQLEHNKKDFFVIGISGGIDSYLTLKLLINNVGQQKIKAFYLQVGDLTSYNDVQLIAKTLGINIHYIDLTNTYNEFVKNLVFANEMQKVNIVPKLRSIYLYSVAQKYNGLVVSCLNYDEYYLGYFTKYGDSAGDVYPLINFLKCEIIELANQLGLDQQIITKPPSAGLLANQLDENDFGFTYSQLDNFLRRKKIDPIIKQKIINLHNNNKHKHTLKHHLFWTNHFHWFN